MMNIFGLNTKPDRAQTYLFCEDQKAVMNKLDTLVLCEIQDNELDGDLYIDHKTGQKWELYEHDDYETYRKPYLKGLRPYPYPSLDAIIDTVCKSLYKDEIKGGCRLLLENEWLGIEFREKLLDEIEKRDVSKRTYKLIYKAAELDQKINRRDPINKRVEEVNADYSYYLGLADRALKLLKK